MTWFIIVFSLYAYTAANAVDIKYEITNNITGQTYGAELDSIKGEAWKQKQIINESWGKDDHNIFYRIGEQHKINATRCDDVMQMDLENNNEEIKTGERCYYLKEYTIVETDITVEVADKEAKKDAKKALREKLKTTNLNLVELNELLRD